MTNFEQYIKKNFGGGNNTDYLGDGAYIGFTGFSYIIFATDGHFISNQIHLEQKELTALDNFVKRMKAKHGK